MKSLLLMSICGIACVEGGAISMTQTDFTVGCSSTSASTCNYLTNDCCAGFYTYQTLVSANTPQYYCMTQAQRENPIWGDYYPDKLGNYYTWYCLDFTQMNSSP